LCFDLLYEVTSNVKEVIIKILALIGSPGVRCQIANSKQLEHKQIFLQVKYCKKKRNMGGCIVKNPGPEGQALFYPQRGFALLEVH
jgi:hypothetical protein